MTRTRGHMIGFIERDPTYHHVCRWVVVISSNMVWLLLYTDLELYIIYDTEYTHQIQKSTRIIRLVHVTWGEDICDVSKR